MRDDTQPVYTEQYTMYSREQLIEQVQMQMSRKRFLHVLGVEEMALGLAGRYGVSLEKASIAALVHDYAKERPADELKYLIRKEGFDLELLDYGNAIWHGVVGAYLVEKELGIHDQEILQAVRLHTSGAAEMSLLDKVIFVADYVEKGRSFPGVEQARQLALSDLDQAVAYETKHTLLHLIESERKIYPKTLETYNRWVVSK